MSVSYKRISVKCMHCGRNQTHYSRAGLWWTCSNPSCKQKNPGPAITSALFLNEETAEKVPAKKPQPDKPAKTVHTVTRPAPAAPKAAAPRKQPAPKRQPRISAVKTTSPRRATPSSPVPAPDPTPAPASKGPGLIDRILYG